MTTKGLDEQQGAVILTCFGKIGYLQMVFDVKKNY